jgi:ubiquitin-protein ligase
MSVRHNRLKADHKAIQRFRSDVVTFSVTSTTDPPEAYRIHYDLKSLVGLDNGRPRFKVGHEIEIVYKPSYPRVKPIVRVVSTPIPLHPNIWKDGRVCIEDRWIPGIGIPLDKICELVGIIISYQGYNLKSPANSNRELADWIRKNRRLMPIDPSQIRLPDARDKIAWGEEEPAPPQARITFG